MKTFRRGGAHPEENKLTNDCSIEVFPLPKQGVVFVSQHLGAPATLIVQKGDRVKTGQLIAKAEQFICANTHSPYTGIISKIDFATDFTGYKKQAVFIEVEEDEWMEGIDTSPDIIRDIKLDSKEIIEKIKEMGIVGLGGAAFPTHIKYMVPQGRTAEFLIINAAECEPYLTSDYRLMSESAEESLIGIQIMKKALGVEKALVGIEENKPVAIHRMTELAKNFTGIEIVPLKTKYPQGAEKQLIYALTKREVPSGKLPIEVGCVVNNIGTAEAIYHAVQKNKPLIENVLTLTGKSVKERKNLLVRVGTPMQSIIDAFGGLPEDTGKVVSGGPMMGKAISDLSAPTVKTTSAILVMSNKESSRKEETNCLRCGKCITVCPMGLEPILIAQLAENRLWEETEKEFAMDCIECGTCLYTCPAGRPLLDMLRLSKNNISELRRKRTQK
ncbi:MAG: electron transport complex subunit RsxC [Bacteroidales bacterium]|nr:electron transport complex subunit RsxC [Bacteroidales bacterium]MDD4683692.1 electron transport complex subunit RsxC [Bacteroidales bacterium]